MATRRPGAATAAGVMCIIFGVLVLMMSLCVGAELVMDLGNNPAFGPGGDLDAVLRRDVPGYFVYRIVNCVVDLLGGAFFLVAGIGIVNVRPWARASGVALCIFFLLATVGSLVYHFTLVAPATRRFFQQALAPVPGGAGFLSGIQDTTVGFISVLMLVYLIIVLALLLQAHVGAAFALAGGRDFDDWDRRYPDDEDDDVRRPRRRSRGYDDEYDDDY